MKTNYNLLTNEQRQIQEMVRDFADREIIPVCKELERDGIFPKELYKKAFDMGLTTFILPEAHGGAGGDIFTYSLIKEELARGDAGFSGYVSGAYMGAIPVMIAGNDYHWKLVSDVLCNGGIMSFTMTEPGSGSDVASMRTTYRRVGNEFVINGRKCFISSGEVSDMYLLFATEDPVLGKDGISAFLVPRTCAGISVGKHEDKMGYRTSMTNDIIFEDVHIPVENLIGKEHQGMALSNASLNYTRPTAGAGAVGNAQYALEQAVEYSKVRVTFGRPICKNQGISFMLADMYTQLEAARQMVWHACKCADAGIFDRRLSSAAKAFAADAGMKVCENAVQILGGYGYSREYPVEKRMRDAKIYQIFEGTNQIQQMIVASDILHS